MKDKKIMIIMFVIFLFSITSVSASEIDTSMAGGDSGQLELSVNDGVVEDYLQTCENNSLLALDVQTDTDVLGADQATYSDLAEEINHQGNITLMHKKYIYNGGESININEANKVIDGNGAVIDMDRSHIRAFTVSVSGVTIKNLTIKNAYYNGDGGAIYFLGLGTVVNCNFTNNHANSGGAVWMYRGNVTNCNFTDNTASLYGGAIHIISGTVSNSNFTDNTASLGGTVYFLNNGKAINCNFIDNKATGSNSCGGAIVFDMGGSVSYCNFTNNFASYHGGAIQFKTSGNVTNCNFNKNTAQNGSAVYFDKDATGRIENCNFTDNIADYGGAVYFRNNGNVTNSNFVNNSAECGGAVYFWNNGNVTNSNFVNNSAVYGGAVYFWNNGDVTNCNFTDNSASEYGGAVYFAIETTGKIKNCNFTNNNADYGGAVYSDAVATAEIKNCNFTNNNADYGGAVYFRNGNVTNSNFTNNKATGPKSWGGAVYIHSGSVENCNFTNNNAYNGGAIYIALGSVKNCNLTKNTASKDGGAIWLSMDSSVENCNFTNNKASGSNSCGGAIRLASGSVKNCNFTNNKASGSNSCGGAVWLYGGSVENCNFTDNSAEYYGGAVWLYEGSVEYCNFTDNFASRDGGAVYFQNNSGVTNCNFTDNFASRDGGAVYFLNNGGVTNCNFTNNKATDDYSFGGAVYFRNNGGVTNCNFVNNKATGKASWGGAIFFGNTGSVENCNFTDNHGFEGGAIFFAYAGSVENCNFAGNNATTGSAIYFFTTSANKSVSNSSFLNNRANAEELRVTKNENNITIIFTGKDNLLNAIYSKNDAEVNFTNVTYWGANGIANTGSSATIPSRSNREAGQNITVGVVVNGELILNGINVTDENGMIVLDNIYAGENYFISVRHDADSYYTEAVQSISNNTKFNVNVTSQTTNNRTVNITAKSNIPNEIIKGELLFIVPNSNQIIANYAGNGTWWILHTFDEYGVYQVNATYVGLDNITVNNATITINKIPTEITVVNSSVDLFVRDFVNAGASLMPADAGSVVYSSSNSSVAKVENGNIIALSEGNTVITVSFNGSEDYAAAENKTITVNVKRVATKVTVENVTAHPGDKINISVNITADDESALNCNVSVILPDGKSNTTEIINGKGNITWTVPDNYTEGNCTIEVSYPGDDRYLPYDAEGKVNIIRYNSKVTISPIEDVDYGNNVTIEYSIENRTTVNVIIDGVSEDKIIITNDAITAIGLNAGKYTITILNNENNKYESSNDTKEFNVNKVDSTLNITDIKFDYNSTGSTTLSYDGATDVNAFVVNHPEAIVNVKDKKIEVSGLDVGTYTFNVTTVPDVNHNPVTKYATITVNKIDSTLIVDDVVLDYGDSTNVTVAVDGATGIVAKIDDKDVVVDGFCVPISGLEAGTYNLTVTTVPDANHNPVTETAIITVNKVDSSLSVGNVVFDYNSTGFTNVTFDGATGVNAIVINHPEAIVNVKDNKIEISGLNAGTYTLSVSTVPDANHNPVTKNATITVNKLKTELAGDAINTTYYIVKDLVISLKDINGNPLSGKNVSVDLDGVKVYVSDINGQIKVSTGGLAPNAYVAKVTFDGDINYEKSTAEIDVTITVGKLLVSAPELIKYVSGPEQFVVNVFSAEGKPMADMEVKITINGVTYTRTTNNDGVASLNVGLGSGEYPVNVLVGSIEVNSTVTIKSTIDANDLVKVFRNASQYSATFVDGNGTPLVNTLVSFNIHGIIYHRLTDENGSAKLNINLEAGDYILTATNPVTGEMYSNLIRVISLVESSDLTKYYRNASQFVVRIHSSDGGYAGAGEEVKFNINGVIYTRTTNATGHAVLNINLGQGNYTITTYYKDCIQGNNIEVLPILSADNLVMKYMDGSQFKARLLDGQGKAYPNQTVTFNIHGIFYDRVTDSDGVAKLNIRLMAGEYIITSSYNDCNIANTIKITA